MSANTIDWPTRTIQDLVEAYSTIRSTSILYTDESVKELVDRNFEKAEFLGRSVTNETGYKTALHQLIENVAWNSLNFLCTDHVEITSKGVTVKETPPPLSVTIKDGVATLTITHMDKDTPTGEAEWTALFDQMDTIRAQETIHIDLTGCKGKYGILYQRLMQEIFGKDTWDTIAFNRYKDVLSEWRVSEGSIKQVEEYLATGISTNPDRLRGLLDSMSEVIGTSETVTDIRAAVEEKDEQPSPDILSKATYKGKIVITTSKDNRGNALFIAYNLKGIKFPNIDIEFRGEWPAKPQLGGEGFTCTLPSGTKLTVPLQRFIYPANFPF